MKYLVCKKVTYYCYKDEDVFFEWIKKISCISSFEEARDELFLNLVDRDLTLDDMTEVTALLYRYKVRMDQLVPFINDANKDAVKSYRKEIYGK